MKMIEQIKFDKTSIFWMVFFFDYWIYYDNAINFKDMIGAE